MPEQKQTPKCPMCGDTGWIGSEPCEYKWWDVSSPLPGAEGERKSSDETLTPSTQATVETQKAPPFNFTPWVPPFTYDPHGTRIVDSKERIILDVRGWGFLTGKGSEALGMHEAAACLIQDAIGDHVTSLLNASSIGRAAGDQVSEKTCPMCIGQKLDVEGDCPTCDYHVSSPSTQSDAAKEKALDLKEPHKADSAPRQKFRKIPVVIEAAQYLQGVSSPSGVYFGQCSPKDNGEPDCREPFPHVHTMHNNQSVVLKDGDWVIPEPDGVHFYPCDAEVFARTYEPITSVSDGGGEHASRVSA